MSFPLNGCGFGITLDSIVNPKYELMAKRVLFPSNEPREWSGHLQLRGILWELSWDSLCLTLDHLGPQGETFRPSVPPGLSEISGKSYIWGIWNAGLRSELILVRLAHLASQGRPFWGTCQDFLETKCVERLIHSGVHLRIICKFFTFF